MRLEPVYLVAPLPKPPMMPTRRAFLLAGGTLAVGATLGGACGYSIGARSSEAAGEMTSSGDVELDELRRLAVKAPIEELVARRLVFLNSVTKRYPKDAVVWRGVERLVDAAVSSAPFDDRRVVSRWLVQVIETGDPELTQNLRPRIIELQKQK